MFTEDMGWGMYLHPISFFISFPISNHSLRFFLCTFFSQKNIFLLLHSFENIGRWEWSAVGPCLFGLLGCTVPDHYQNLNSKGGELEQNIPRVVRGIARRGRDCVLVLMVGHKLPLLLFHPYLLHSEGLGRKTWGVIYHVFLHALLLRRLAHRLLSLLVLSLTLVATCECVWRGFD